MTQTISKSEAVEKILATNGRIFSAKAIKRSNGEPRTFTGILSKNVEKGRAGGELTFNAAAKNLIVIYETNNGRPDTDKRRMINADGLFEVTVDGETFAVAE